MEKKEKKSLSLSLCWQGRWEWRRRGSCWLDTRLWLNSSTRRHSFCFVFYASPATIYISGGNVYTRSSTRRERKKERTFTRRLSLHLSQAGACQLQTSYDVSLSPKHGALVPIRNEIAGRSQIVIIFSLLLLEGKRLFIVLVGLVQQ